MAVLQLPSYWNELLVFQSGDNTFQRYSFPFYVNKISLEISGKLTFYELWGGDITDWGNIIYDIEKYTLKLESQMASDNLIIVSYR